jgi:holin-like protein
MRKNSSLLTQLLIYAAILFVSELLAKVFQQVLPDFPLPTPLIGMVLLYLLLTSGIVKLRQVETIAQGLLSVIGLIFIPSGIALVTQLDLLQHEGLQIVIVIILSTILMLVVTAGITAILLKLTQRR